MIKAVVEWVFYGFLAAGLSYHAGLVCYQEFLKFGSDLEMRSLRALTRLWWFYGALCAALALASVTLFRETRGLGAGICFGVLAGVVLVLIVFADRREDLRTRLLRLHAWGSNISLVFQLGFLPVGCLLGVIGHNGRPSTAFLAVGWKQGLIRPLIAGVIVAAIVAIVHLVIRGLKCRIPRLVLHWRALDLALGTIPILIIPLLAASPLWSSALVVFLGLAAGLVIAAPSCRFPFWRDRWPLVLSTTAFLTTTTVTAATSGLLLDATFISDNHVLLVIVVASAAFVYTAVWRPLE